MLSRSVLQLGIRQCRKLHRDFDSSSVLQVDVKALTVSVCREAEAEGVYSDIFEYSLSQENGTNFPTSSLYGTKRGFAIFFSVGWKYIKINCKRPWDYFENFWSHDTFSNCKEANRSKNQLQKKNLN